MKALFVHCSRMLRALDGQVYSRGFLLYSVWQRYLKHFDELMVTTRMADCKQVAEKLSLSSGPSLHFANVPDDHGKPQSFTKLNQFLQHAVHINLFSGSK